MGDVERFGELLTGEETTDWRALRTVYHGQDADGRSLLSLQLSEEQQEDFISAELMVLSNEFGRKKGELPLSCIYTVQAEKDGNGVLHADYGGEALYVEDDRGNRLSGPVSYIRDEEEDCYRIQVTYHDLSAGFEVKKDALVVYDAVPDPETGNLDLIRVYVHDPATHTYTNRIPFTEEGYTEARFTGLSRRYAGETVENRGYSDWEYYMEGYHAYRIPLDTPWHLRFEKQWSANDLYAMFQVTDSRQNTYSSIPVLLEKPGNTEIPVQAQYEAAEGTALRFSAVRKQNENLPEVELVMTVENRTGQELKITNDRMILNGRQMAAVYFIRRDGSGEDSAEEYEVHLTGERLTGLKDLSSVDFTLKVKPKDSSGEEIRIPVHLELRDCPLEGVADEAPSPMAEKTVEGVTWQLLSLRQDETGQFLGLLRVRNDTDETVCPVPGIGINSVLLPSFTSDLYLYPHTEEYVSFTARDGDIIEKLPLKITDSNLISAMGISQAVEQEGGAIRGAGGSVSGSEECDERSR